MADHLVVIARGKVKARTTVAEFVEAHSAGGGAVYVRVADGPAFARVLDGAGMADYTFEESDGRCGAGFVVAGADSRTMMELAVANDVEIHELTSRGSSLERAFIAVVADESDHRARAVGGEGRPE
ncbi:hypothetical protein [Amycolatopsis minnesotensis]|uniref:ABC-2 type transport system ATP-binding protein n=1 Tax=Amycolatopsis minnesotensis TaxID=337894 RepID=A0ABN2QRD7_9PSEU